MNEDQTSFTEDEVKEQAEELGLEVEPELLETVTPKEFFTWLQANEHKTWSHGKNGGFSSKEGSSPIFKYFRLNLDTRDMRIFNIETDSMHTSTDYRDEAPEGAKNLLDMLDVKAKTWKDEEEVSMLKRKLMGRFPDLDFKQVMMALTFLQEDLIDKWWADKYNQDGRDFKWEKKQFTYHEMKARLSELIESERK